MLRTLFVAALVLTIGLAAASEDSTPTNDAMIVPEGMFEAAMIPPALATTGTAERELIEVSAPAEDLMLTEEDASDGTQAGYGRRRRRRRVFKAIAKGISKHAKKVTPRGVTTGGFPGLAGCPLLPGVWWLASYAVSSRAMLCRLPCMVLVLWLFVGSRRPPPIVPLSVC
jgi:hypothetical protein